MVEICRDQRKAVTLYSWFWLNVISDSSIGAEFSTKFKAGGGVKEERSNGHWLAFNDLCERVALKFIEVSNCVDAEDIDEQTMLDRCLGKEGTRLLCNENKNTRKLFLEQWSWEVGHGDGKRSGAVKLGYQMALDKQVCLI